MRALPLFLALLVACGDDDDDTVVVDGGSTIDTGSSIDAAEGADAAPDAAVVPDAAQPVTVQVLAFNDFHGNLEPPAGGSGNVVTGVADAGPPPTVPAGGAAFLASHIATLRAAEPNTVVVSAGDLIGASPLLSGLFHDEPTIEAMNLIGLDLAAVGNHEFDEGGAELLRMQHGGCHPVDGCADGSGFAGASFHFLAANVVVDAASGKTLFPRYEIREFNGVPVAFIGMTLEGTPAIVTPQGVAGLEFKDEVETVNQLVPELVGLGVRAIVVLVHQGGFQTGLYDDCVGISGAIVDLVTGLDDEVDLVVSGHTHAAYNCEIDGKRVTSALSFGRLVTKILLTIDPLSHDVTAIEAENTIVARVVAAPMLQALIDAYLTLVAPLRDRVIGETTGALDRMASPAGETVLGNVIADGQLAATASPTTGGAVVAFMNPGGIRADVDAGPVTFGEVFTVQPFGNSLVVLTLTGAQLDTLLEQQFGATVTRVLQVSAGFSYTWSASAPMGMKVDAASIKIGGVTVDPLATYRVTVNSFLATGGDGFVVLREGKDRLGGALDLDAFEDHLVAESPLAPPALGRITRVP